MKLNKAGVESRTQWLNKGYELPKFDREKVIKATKENPFWIHFGAGNIFRAFQANVVQNLLNQGVIDKGLVAAEGYDYEIIEKMNRPHDDYSILVTLKADGSVEKTVVGSIAESLTLDALNNKDFNRLKEIFAKDSLQMATFTITEKGYSLVNGKGDILPDVAEDFKNGPESPKSYIGKVTALLYARFMAGEKPIALVSMDNCSHNGDKLYAAVSAFAGRWADIGAVKREFTSYIADKNRVSFPWTMIDKITPRPDSLVTEMLKADGLEDADAVVTLKNTYIAPFVNAEEPQYLVVEDAFPNGRPNLELGGIIFTDRKTVEKVERMKVCTCLNPLHTALAVFGCLLSYTKISDEMKDASLRKLVFDMGYNEGLPVVTDPGIINPKEFIDEVLNVRIPNPFMPDTPQRIATDTSQKIAIRYGETIKAYMTAADKDVKSLKLIPLVLAGWCRYLMGISDEGKPFEVSPDPLYDSLKPYVENIALGSSMDFEEVLKPILSNQQIFGVDLYEIGMAKRVAGYFGEMAAGVGAVRKTLEKYVGV